MMTFIEKVIISLVAAVLFLLISAPFTYELTNKMGLKTEESKGCPSTQGLLIHTVIFFVVVFLILLIPMGAKK